MTTSLKTREIPIYSPIVPQLPPLLDSFIKGDGTSWSAIEAASFIMTDVKTIFVQTVGNNTYSIFKAPVAGTITALSSICRSGTATATFAINASNITVTANSVTSTSQTQTPTAANVFAAGDYIKVTISSNSTCLDMTLSVTFTRKIYA